MDNGKSQSIDQRERERKSHDKIRINNPFDKDYATIWDGFAHVVPAHGFAILDRFLADKWLEEQCKRIITETADNAVKAENKRRLTNNQLPLDKTRKTGEQLEFETPYYANWTARFAEVIQEYGLFGGIEQEFGMDYMPSAQSEQKDMNLSLTDQLVKAPLKVQSKPSDSLIDDLQAKDVFTLHKIAKERGITTEKTDKKADLIKQLTA